MKLTGHIEKWAGGILGTVSAILLLNLVLQFSGVWAGSRRPTALPPRAAQKGKTHEIDDLTRLDSSVQLDLLKRYDQRPLPELSRNPFEFVAPPAAPAKPDSGPAPTSVQPPAPPPVTLKPTGYSEIAGGQKEAYACDQNAAKPQECAEGGQVYVVHEGDTVANKYKILKITPTAITVEDVGTHQTVELPIPQ